MAIPNGGKQMNINYTYGASASGIDIIVDLECDLECTVDYAYGDIEPDVTIDSVTIFSGDARLCLDDSDDPTLLRIRGDIIAAALADDAFIEEACEASGIRWYGLNGNDPEQVWGSV
jgi:hypothetical protein